MERLFVYTLAEKPPPLVFFVFAAIACIPCTLHTARMRVPWTLLWALSLCAAYLFGRIAAQMTLAAPPMTIVPDPRPHIPVVMIAGIEGGRLVGTVTGSGRVIVAGKTVVPDAEGAFAAAITLPPAATRSGTARTPSVPASDAAFVASKRGKKYYPVGSKGAANLSPKNLIYFRSAEEAEAAGYRR